MTNKSKSRSKSKSKSKSKLKKYSKKYSSKKVSFFQYVKKYGRGKIINSMIKLQPNIKFRNFADGKKTKQK